MNSSIRCVGRRETKQETTIGRSLAGHVFMLNPKTLYLRMHSADERVRDPGVAACLMSLSDANRRRIFKALSSGNDESFWEYFVDDTSESKERAVHLEGFFLPKPVLAARKFLKTKAGEARDAFGRWLRDEDSGPPGDCEFGGSEDVELNEDENDDQLNEKTQFIGDMEGGPGDIEGTPGDIEGGLGDIEAGEAGPRGGDIERPKERRELVLVYRWPPATRYHAPRASEPACPAKAIRTPDALFVSLKGLSLKDNRAYEPGLLFRRQPCFGGVWRDSPQAADTPIAAPSTSSDLSQSTASTSRGHVQSKASKSGDFDPQLFYKVEMGLRSRRVDGCKEQLQSAFREFESLLKQKAEAQRADNYFRYPLERGKPVECQILISQQSEKREITW